MRTSKAAIVVSAIMGKLRSIIGYALGLFSLLCIWVAATEMHGFSGLSMVIFFTIMLGGCILLVISGAKTKKRISRFKQYVSIISKENMNTLDCLASATSQSVDFVKNDLQAMIDKHFFVDAFINLGTGEIVIGNHVQHSVPENGNTNNKTNDTVKPNITSEIEHVKCPGCGASNSKSKGIAINCDYCGTQIM